MTKLYSGLRFLRVAQVLSIVLFFSLTACNQGATKTTGFPASPGFNEKESDKKALEIVDRMMDNLGGYDAWQNARYIGWTYFGQYNIWDKKEGLFRHEKGNQVSIMNLNKKAGQVYINGAQITDTVQLFNYLTQSYTYFVANTYFLAMPYKMKDGGVTLKYRGEDKTKDGKPADVVRLMFKDVGISPYNMHDVWIEKETGLPAQWAFYAMQQDQAPAFVRKWTDYKDFNGIKLATNRNSADDTLAISHIVVTDVVPKEIFLSPTPVDKSKIK